MPVFNAAATCDHALASLVAQTFADFEVIAVDDGSTDASLTQLQRWAARDSRIRVIVAPHRGLVQALNHGLDHCSGEYVARMDADDWSHPERLHRQRLLLCEQSDISVAGCLVEAFPPQQVGEGFRIYLDWLNALVQPADIAREIFIESPIVHPSAMMYREELLSLGGYQDHGWPEDYDLWLRYHTAGKRFAKVPAPLFRWREHPARMTHTDSRYSVENFIRAKARYLLDGPLRTRTNPIIWGAGKTGRRLAKHLERGGRQPHCFVDIAPDKIGGTLRRAPIIAPCELPTHWHSLSRPILLVAVASRGARQLIRAHLRGLSLTEARDFYCTT